MKTITVLTGTQWFNRREEATNLHRKGKGRRFGSSCIPRLTAGPARFVSPVATIIVAMFVLATGASGATAAPGPPPVTILTPATHLGKGNIFVTPTGDIGQYANGPEILDAQGNVVFFHAISPSKLAMGEVASDFRTQSYNGNEVLTWWQGIGLGGLSCGTDFIFNNQFMQIATVQAGNALCADGHEFLITPSNTALITIYQESTADVTSCGGPADQTVINGIVQEIDIATGRVLFQWNSAAHVSFCNSEKPLPPKASDPWDWFHLNAVKVDTDGNLLIGARHTWATYKIEHSTGQIIWTLGGKASNFTLKPALGQVLDHANELFAWQHDPEPLGNDVYTFFDNEGNGASPPLLPDSRAITVQLDESTRVATLVASDNQPESLVAPSQGNAQMTSDGNLFVGWGALPFFSAFDPGGTLIFNARFPTGVDSYRAYFLPFTPGK
jgi:hypothetical protein